MNGQIDSLAKVQEALKEDIKEIKVLISNKKEGISLLILIIFNGVLNCTIRLPFYSYIIIL
ncbi:MAG: hypothetical protein BAJALOKI1v1_1450005 [Promethearchaeota archaeon]|nr:MAG: hypothetical protein BAJALOKI1v1_1450005 [Candidatus Lokiarchaeota archaeon]